MEDGTNNKHGKSVPVTIISPINAHALGQQAVQIAIATSILLFDAQTKALDSYLGHGAKWIVPWTMLIAGLTSMAAAITTSRVADKAVTLRAEMFATILWGAMTMAYALSLTSTYGYSGSPVTQSWAWISSVFAFGRAAQCWHDRRKFINSRNQGDTTEVLAQSKTPN